MQILTHYLLGEFKRTPACVGARRGRRSRGRSALKGPTQREGVILRLRCWVDAPATLNFHNCHWPRSAGVLLPLPDLIKRMPLFYLEPDAGVGVGCACRIT
ncbi:hypothetical protein EVAR_74864_1 [Eumeta japonica]|uniref:Uncharacterized protein n=1 Tax=Eumeta variegata TaxID=151549 RepID=A0A4C1SSW0_EUMVA|nr:hypothetical protein EVAR_74864_1 [Eumeta japonica]